MDTEINRRDFLIQTAIAGGTLLAFGGTLPVIAQEERAMPNTKPLRLLILGGTGFIGPHFVRTAVERGHAVSVFNRGKSHADLPAGVERLLGDRNGDLKSIQNRDWDAVLDLSAYGPIWVRKVGQALKGRVGHYTFISTIATYEHPEIGGQISENSPVLTYAGSEDPYSLTEPRSMQEYGALKVLCEREAERQFPGNTLILRVGYIAGPGDPQGYLTYLPARMEKGGDVLLSGDPSTPVQFIDVRDVADSSVCIAEKRTTGVYNTVGPAVPTSLGQLIQAACAAASTSPSVTWVPAAWLALQKDREMWGKLLFWTFESEGLAWAMRVNIERALAKGLKIRPANTTLADTLDWYRNLPEERQAQLLSISRKKADGSGWEMESIRWQAYLERERETLTAWRAQQIRKS